MRRVAAIAIVVLAASASARAQTLTLSDEIDPIRAGVAPRDDLPQLYRIGEGFAIAGVSAFDGALHPVPSREYLADCLPDAIGTTTCLRYQGPTNDLRRISLLDGSPVDAAPFASPVMPGLYLHPLIAAVGDDYVAVLDSRQIHVWRAGAPPDTTELVPTTCPLCYVNAIACAERGCSVIISSGFSDGAATLFRVDVGAVPRLGASRALGPSYARAQLVALDDQWVVIAPGGAMDFFDDALGSLGSTPVPAGTLACASDACLVVDTFGAVSRCRSGACTSFASLPSIVPGFAPWMVCGPASCGVLLNGIGGLRIEGLSARDGSSAELTDTYWSRPSDALLPVVAVTSSGALLVYRDDRGGMVRPAIVPVAPGLTSDPTFPDLVASTDDGTSWALLPTPSGATWVRLDHSLVPSWVRLSASGTLLDQRSDAFSCLGPVASGPHGIEMACTDASSRPTTLSFSHLADDGRPNGTTLSLPIGGAAGVALGDMRSLVIDDHARAVLVDEPAGPAGPVIDLSSRHRLSPVVAAGGGRFLVISEDFDTLIGTVLDGGGRTTPLPTGLRPRGEASVSGARVVFDGSTFLVAWIESSTSEPLTRLVLRRVRPDGALDPTLIELARTRDASLDDLDRMDLATDGAGRSVVAFVRTDTSAGGYPRSSVHAREIRSLAPDGTACTTPDACGSDVCVDGVCCAVPCEGACSACSVATGARADGECANTCDDAGVDSGPRSDASVGTRDAGAGRDGGLGFRVVGGCRCSAAAARGSWPAAIAVAWIVGLCCRRRRRRRVSRAAPTR